MERKYAEVREGIIRNNSLWDKLIFHKVQVLKSSGSDPTDTDFLFSVTQCER